jgi:photosystem II stability/assembly factor-like uncharacterized protein/pimeloyl-ACP methyl ester carboxylesterase
MGVPRVRLALLVIAAAVGGSLDDTNRARAADPLPRRAGPMGMRLEHLPTGGLRIVEVLPGSPAADGGLEPGLRVSGINGQAIDTMEQLLRAMQRVTGGTNVIVEVRRGDEAPRNVTIAVASLGSETAPGSRVLYDSVTVPAGYRLRTIVTEPIDSPRVTDGGVPAVLAVQGIACQSIDRPGIPGAVDTRLIHALAEAGFATMRVDKPGLGDSEGPPCSEIDFETELEAYKAALRQLRAMPGIDPERIFVFGHSMGGVMAPYLSAEETVRGSMVYGTIIRSWFEYQLENVRRQARLQPGATEAMVTDAVQAEARSSAMVLVDKKTLGDVWTRWPELRQPTQGTILDETHQSTRHMSFFHQLQELNLGRAWAESRGDVLAIWGEYDWVTAREDHETIADVVNRRSPGAGSVLVMPRADHAFTTHDSLEASVTAMGEGEWDATLPGKLIAWMEGVERGHKVGPRQPSEPAEPLVAPVDPNAAAGLWKKLPTEPYPGKQDDIFFVNPEIGWYGNGAGKVFSTTDGGTTWTKVWENPGTFVRCLAFFDANVGVLGNIGPGSFPNVTDILPLYRTVNGGVTWKPVTAIEGNPVVGLCAFDIVSVPFINDGHVEHRPRIIGVGRLGGPAAFVWSDDLGASWQQGSLPAVAAMAFDVKFLDEKRGFIASATNADVAESRALILATEDGGDSWNEVYRSSRPFEVTWKLSFPTDAIGYCTVQSYDPEPNASRRFVAKTIDGGRSWTEMLLVDDHRVREFGIAFVDADTGWVGAMPHGFETTDGGTTWRKASFGNAVNKIRLVDADDGVTGYAIGVDVHKLHRPAAPP